jgi:RNA polymerase sigma-70 factor (ECF subfamily)
MPMAPKPQADCRGETSESFVQLLTSEQFRLQHYITMLLGNVDAAQNVLQEANLVMWRKVNEFTMGSDFGAWARQICYWQVQAYLRDKQRERHVFSNILIAELASQESTAQDELESRVALRDCMSKVSSANAGLLRDRYADDLSIAVIAKKLGKTESAIKVQLMRLRRILAQCIERNLAHSTLRD